MVSGELRADYPGRPYYLRLRWSTNTSSIGGNYSRYNWELAAVSKSGWGSYAYACGNWHVHVAGYNYSGCDALVFTPGDFAGKTIVLGSGVTGNVVHDSRGYKRFQVAADHQAPGPFGTATIPYTWDDADRIPKVPAAPTPLSLDQVTTTSMRYRFQANDNGGSPVTSWQVNYDDNPEFSSPVVDTSTGTETYTGLAPGTKFYFRARGINAVGAGPWSAILSATTIPGTAPGIFITPYISGMGADATMSPPGGVTGVTEYNLQYRPTLGGTTIDRSTTGTVVHVTSGLTPGVSYEWRANAEIGGYTSPWSDWIAVDQPSPNTGAGEFFSGSSQDTLDTDFEWAGTAENSISHARLNVVRGWLTFEEGAGDSGGTGVVGQVAGALAGGYVGDWLAKVIFHSDTDGEGFIAGVGWAAGGTTDPGSTYHGSIYFRTPTRDQRMQAGIAWYNVVGDIESITWSGDEVVVEAHSTSFTRLTAEGVAPIGTVRGGPVVRDVSGTGWSAWQGGEVFFLDAAMLSLGGVFSYFDGSFEDTLQYDFEWEGPAHQSASVRHNLATVDPAVLALLDPDCDPPPAPPLPPSIPSDCIEDVGVWRRYIVQVPAGEVRLWSATLPTLILTTGSVAERQVRIRYFPNPEGVAPEAVDTSDWEAEMILSYIPPNTRVMLDGVTQRVRAEVNGADAIVANQLLYGTNGTPATWPVLRCGVGYIITLDVPTDAPSGNLETDLLLTQRV